MISSGDAVTQSFLNFFRLFLPIFLSYLNFRGNTNVFLLQLLPFPANSTVLVNFSAPLCYPHVMTNTEKFHKGVLYNLSRRRILI
jgi:hypothetical protein